MALFVGLLGGEQSLVVNNRVVHLCMQTTANRGITVHDFRLVNPENADLCDFSKSQWYTPPELAQRIVRWAFTPFGDCNDVLPKLRALEPSAGRGALASVLRQYVRSVTCVEIDPVNVEYLAGQGFSVYEKNFLEFDGDDLCFNLGVMNPPFEDGQAEQHVLHAIELADRVVAHVPLTTLAGKERRAGLWSKAYLKRLAIHSSRPKYSGSKTGGQTDMCTIDVVRRYEHHDSVRTHVAASGVDVEWWS